jgi:hypothetical protein
MPYDNDSDRSVIFGGNLKKECVMIKKTGLSLMVLLMAAGPSILWGMMELKAPHDLMKRPKYDGLDRAEKEGRLIYKDMLSDLAKHLFDGENFKDLDVADKDHPLVITQEEKDVLLKPLLDIGNLNSIILMPSGSPESIQRKGMVLDALAQVKKVARDNPKWHELLPQIDYAIKNLDTAFKALQERNSRFARFARPADPALSVQTLPMASPVRTITSKSQITQEVAELSALAAQLSPSSAKEAIEQKIKTIMNMVSSLR